MKGGGKSNVNGSISHQSSKKVVKKKENIEWKKTKTRWRSSEWFTVSDD